MNGELEDEQVESSHAERKQLLAIFPRRDWHRMEVVKERHIVLFQWLTCRKVEYIRNGLPLDRINSSLNSVFGETPVFQASFDF